MLFLTPILALFTDGAATTREQYKMKSSLGVVCRKFPKLNYSGTIHHPDNTPWFAEVVAVDVCLQRLTKDITDSFHCFIFTDSLFLVKELQIMNLCRKERRRMTTDKQQGYSKEDSEDEWTKVPKKPRKEKQLKTNKRKVGYTEEQINLEKKHRLYLNRIIERAGGFKNGVTIIYNPAHSGVLGNELADIYAAAALESADKDFLKKKLNDLKQRLLKPKDKQPFISAHFEIYPGTQADWEDYQRPPSYDQFVTQLKDDKLNKLKKVVEQYIPDAFEDEDREKLQDLQERLLELRTTPREEKQPLYPKDFLRIEDAVSLSLLINRM